MNTHLNRQGFTLIELAIVIVVISLVLGGMLAGKKLIRAAQFKGVITQAERYLAAKVTYKSKYNALAGDHSKAENFFGASATNNGNGNGIIDEHGANQPDKWLFWQHMALAGLIEGTYTGANGPLAAPIINVDAVIGTNIPGSQIPGVGFGIVYSLTNTNMGVLPAGHSILIGRDTNDTSTYDTYGPWASVAEIYTLDVKIDDGLANNGTIRMHPGGGLHGLGSCGTGVAPDHTYNMSHTTETCVLHYLFTP